jgi:hypothetical protein
MTKREFVSIALKLMAIWVLVKSSAYLFPLTLLLQGYLDAGAPAFATIPKRDLFERFLGTLPELAHLGIAAALWFFSKNLAGVIVEKSDDTPTFSISARELLCIAFAIFGVLLMCMGAGDIAGELYRKSVGNNPYENITHTARLISAGVPFLVGLGFFFWASRSLRVLTSPRDWGRHQNDD